MRTHLLLVVVVLFFAGCASQPSAPSSASAHVEPQGEAVGHFYWHAPHTIPTTLSIAVDGVEAITATKNTPVQFKLPARQRQLFPASDDN